MTDQDIMSRLTETQALRTGHFLLRSGLHSDRFFQAALLLQHTLIAAELCAELAGRFRDVAVDAVISPAVGGIVVGQEVGRALGVRAVFAEKDDDSNLVLRRGFEIRSGERFLVAEDVVTRGGRVQQTMDLVREHGGVVVGIAVLVDRSGGNAVFDAPLQSLCAMDLATYDPGDCPLCRQGVPLERPGSK
jgi:orotate phosphoribosyltransferase